jgi:MFS family permease
LEEDRHERSRLIRTTIGIGVVGFFAQAGWATLNFSALPMWVQFHLHQGQYLGLIIAAFIVTEATFRPFLGALSDRMGRKRVILIGPAMGVITSIITIYIPGALLLIPLRALDGVGLAGFWPASYAIIGDTFGEERRGTGSSVLNGSGMAGIALGWLAGGLANDLTRSLSGAFYFVSAMFLVTVVAGAVLLPEPVHRHLHGQLDEGWMRLPRKQELAWILGSFPDMLVLNLVMFTGVGILMPIFKLYAVQQYHLTETLIGIIVAPAALALGLIAVPLGRLSDRWGPLVSVRYGLLLCTVGMWVVAASSTFRLAAFAAVLIGAGFMAAYPAWMALVSSAAPLERRGQVLGAVGMAEGIGAIIGVLIGPIIYASKWNPVPGLGITHLNLPFYLSAVLVSSATGLAFTWLSRRRGIQSPKNADHGF